jgi:hypothetical protein
MRKYLILPVLAVGLLLGTLGTTAFAGTGAIGSSTYYPGQNSQGQKLFFSVDQTSSGPKFDPFFTTMVDRCPVTGTTITIDFSFTGFQVPIKNGKFSLNLNDISDRFHWSGTVAPKKASGTESYQLAGFDKQAGLQDCTTGSVSWTAQGLAPSSSRPAAPSGSYHVTITRASNGSVHYSVTH